jgi:hypothetical protein
MRTAPDTERQPTVTAEYSGDFSQGSLAVREKLKALLAKHSVE